MTTAPADQAHRLHQAVTELVKRYQFRDRHEVCCHGISVSQCYALAALEDGEQSTMGELAGRMQLSVSTMTRVVDQLVGKDLVRRCTHPGDRRVCCVQVTGSGRKLLGRIHGGMLEMEQAILDQLEPADRESLIRSLGLLVEAVDRWRGQCSPACCRDTQTDKGED